MSGSINYKRIRCSIYAIIILYIIYLIASFTFYRYKQTDIFNGGTVTSIAAEVPVGEISEGTEIIQTIPIQTNISELKLMFATYARENAGEIKIEITGQPSGTVYAQSVFDASEMIDNSFVTVPFQQTAYRNQENLLSVRITSNSEPGQGVTIWSSNQNAVDGASLTVNGTQMPGDLVYTIVSEVEMPPYWSIEKLFVLLGIAVLVCAYPRFIKPCLQRFAVEEKECMLYCALFLLGLIILFFRSAYNFMVPSMYAEDGVWSASIINNGLLDTLLHARGDYLVLGNVLLLQLALGLNELFLGYNINYLPVFVAVVQYLFFSGCAVLPVWCFKRDMSKYMRLILWLLIMLVPVGTTGYEIWGKICNTGFMFYFIASCLLFRRIFHRNHNSRPSIVLGDIMLFLCCGTHEGAYVLVAAGFVLDVVLQIPELRTQEHKVKYWLSKFSNQMWLVLGICCAVIAAYDLFVLRGVQDYGGIEGNTNNIIELWGRLALFYGTSLFYEWLNNGMVVVIFLVMTGWFLFTFWKIRKEKMDVIKLTFCLLVALFYCLIAFVARFDVLSSGLSDYSTTVWDRFYYAINISCLIPFIMSLSLIYRKGECLIRFIVATALTFLILLPVADYSKTFPYDNPQISGAHVVSFSERLNAAEYDTVSGLYTINIEPDGWTVQLPEKYITASRAS